MSAPPAAADRLIQRSHGDTVVAAIVGDLHEEYAEPRRRSRRRSKTPTAPSLPPPWNRPSQHAPCSAP